VTAKETLLERVAELSEDEAAWLLAQLDDPGDLSSDAPLTDAQRASIRRGLADSAAGRVYDVEEVEREFGIAE
jgi:predicted transcriptional regulator